MKHILTILLAFTVLACNNTSETIEKDSITVFYQLIQYDYDGKAEEHNIISETTNQRTLITTIPCTFDTDPDCFCDDNPTDPKCIGLPIELFYFETEAIASGILIKWKTAMELENDYVNLLASLNGVDWKIIHTEKGNPECSSGCSYEYIDNLNWIE